MYDESDVELTFVDAHVDISEYAEQFVSMAAVLLRYEMVSGPATEHTLLHNIRRLTHGIVNVSRSPHVLYGDS